MPVTMSAGMKQPTKATIAAFHKEMVADERGGEGVGSGPNRHIGAQSR